MSSQSTHSAVPFPGIIPANMNCSICLEDILDDNQKGITKLQCGHFFHLACVGVAFNVKGAMVCPNCREVENSEWKYSRGTCTHNHVPLLDGEEVITLADGDVYHVIRQSIHNVFTYYDDDNSHPADMYQGVQATNYGSIYSLFEDNQSMQVGSMFESFPYNMISEVPSFDFIDVGSSNIRATTPQANVRENTYVGLYLSSDGTLGVVAPNNPPSSISPSNNNLDHYTSVVQNSNGSGMTRAGSSSRGARTSGQGGGRMLEQPLRIGTQSNLNNIPSLFDLISTSSRPPNVGQGLHCNIRELDTDEPEVVYLGTRSSAAAAAASASASASASAGPLDLGLNMSIDGGSLYDN